MGIPHQLVLLASCVDELQQSLVQLKIPHTDVLLILLIHRGFAGVVRDENLQERRLKSRASVRFSTLRSNRTRAARAFRCRSHLLAGALFFARVRLAKRHLEVEARHHGLDHVGIPAIPSVRLAEEDRECRDTPPGMDHVDEIPGCCESDPPLSAIHGAVHGLTTSSQSCTPHPSGGPRRSRWARTSHEPCSRS